MAIDVAPILVVFAIIKFVFGGLLFTTDLPWWAKVIILFFAFYFNNYIPVLGLIADIVMIASVISCRKGKEEKGEYKPVDKIDITKIDLGE